MGFGKDFKAFAMKGNVVDLAVGVIIGGAFGKIVTAMVDDVIMPLISSITGGGKFDDFMVILKSGKDGASSYPTLAAAKEAGANVFAYGHFIQSILDFVIIALCIFIAIKGIARLERKKEEAPAVVSNQEVLLTEIRDLLKSGNRPG